MQSFAHHQSQFAVWCEQGTGDGKTQLLVKGPRGLVLFRDTQFNQRALAGLGFLDELVDDGCAEPLTPVRGRDAHIGNLGLVATGKMELPLAHQVIVLLHQQIKQTVLLLSSYPTKEARIKLFPGFFGEKVGVDGWPIVKNSLT